MKDFRRAQIIIPILLLLLFPPSYAGWQRCVELNDAMLPHVSSLEDQSGVYYDSRVFVTTDSGENWKTITIGFSSYYYSPGSSGNELDLEGTSKTNTNTGSDSQVQTAGENPGGGFSGDEIINNASGDSEPVYTGSAEILNYLVKITNYVKYNITCCGGKKSVRVTREKLTQGLYNLRFNGSNLIRTFNYYKLESEGGTFKREWFS